MKEKLQPINCRYCKSENVAVVEVDQQWNDHIFAVRCDSCYAEGPHCVTEEMAVRMWGIKEPEFIPQPEPINWNEFPELSKGERV